ETAQVAIGCGRQREVGIRCAAHRHRVAWKKTAPLKPLIGRRATAEQNRAPVQRLGSADMIGDARGFFGDDRRRSTELAGRQQLHVVYEYCVVRAAAILEVVKAQRERSLTPRCERQGLIVEELARRSN